MKDDLLTSYQKSAYQSILANDSTCSELDEYRCAHHSRFSTYLAYLLSASSCGNHICCLILEQKLKDYTLLIDNRKGINNFASVAKSLAHNVTNLSKKWSSGLEHSLIDVSAEKVLRQCESVGDCENPSTNGCIVGQPSQLDADNFFSTLSGIRDSRRKHLPRIQSTDAESLLTYNQDDIRKKKSSLYSTYEDSYLDSSRCLNNAKVIPSSSGQQLSNNFKPPSTDNQTRLKRHDENLVKRNSGKICTSSKQGSCNRIEKLSKYHNDDEQVLRKSLDMFKTATETLKIQAQMRYGGGKQYQCSNQSQGGVKKSLGGKGTRVSSGRFVPPLRSSQDEDGDMLITRSVLGRQGTSSRPSSHQPDEEVDERLKHLDPKMVELIRSEIMDQGATVTWDDIAGLEFAKHTIQEIVVWPMLRPDIFTGLRRPPKGILLFGPPGTGKTLIGKCIASQSKSTFFSISASSLTSKWIGDGEKMVRALFAVARVEQPSVVFIDEIDSLLSQRSDQEHESSRRIKTEFLVQLDGAATGEEDRLLIIGATNRPQELDEAARRRLVKRLYIPLPDNQARKQLVSNLMAKERNDLTEENIAEVAALTEGYSGADMKNLCQEACLGPIRMLSASVIAHIDANQVRAVNLDDFKQALKRVRSSVSSKDLDLYIEWDKQFGMSA